MRKIKTPKINFPDPMGKIMSYLKFKSKFMNSVQRTLETVTMVAAKISSRPRFMMISQVVPSTGQCEMIIIRVEEISDIKPFSIENTEHFLVQFKEDYRLNLELHCQSLIFFDCNRVIFSAHTMTQIEKHLGLGRDSYVL